MQGVRSWGPGFALVSCALALVAAPACGSDDSSKANEAVAGEGDGSAGTSQGGSKAPSSEAGAPGSTSEAGGTSEGGSAGTLGEGGSSAAAQAGAGGAAQPCSGEPRCLDDTTAATCPASGVLQTLECTNGCVAGACAPTDLSTGWKLHQFVLTDDAMQVNASYSFSANGLSALQTQNSLPSIYYLDRDLESVTIRGSFAVETASDDDLIGFVFGMQDTEHFYLFDWKQAAQSDGTCGNADVGALLKVVSGTAALTTCKDFWSSTTTSAMQVLVPASENPTAWLDNTVYDFTLVHTPGHIVITVKSGADTVVSLSSNDATYTHGRFGFYNYSQEASRYEFFEFQPSE